MGNNSALTSHGFPEKKIPLVCLFVRSIVHADAQMVVASLPPPSSFFFGG